MVASGIRNVPADAHHRIRRLRSQLGLTQTELAELMGVSFATVNRWENRQTHPSPLAWRQLAQMETGKAEARSVARSLRPSRGKLPARLRKLLWEHDARLEWPKDADLITSRVLASGGWEDVQWLRRMLSDRELREWIAARSGRGLTPRQLSFWQVVLAIPPGQVTGWLASPARSSWDERVAR